MKRRDHPRYNQSTSPGLEARFWEKVADNGECWIWTGSLDSWGYGTVKVDGKSRKSHRVSWELATGSPVPAGMLVLHRCDNPPCVRPSHLFLGTSADNAHDRDAKGRGVPPPRLTGPACGSYRHGRRMGERRRPAA